MNPNSDRFRLYPILPMVVIVCLLAGAGIGGCKPRVTPETNGEPGTTVAVALKLLVIDDEAMAEAIRRQWSTRGEGELQVVTATSDAMRKEGASLSSADAIVFPTSMLGEFVAAQYIVPFPEKVLQDENLAWRDVFDLIRLRECLWGRTVMAIPLGSATPLLWYREDLWKKHGLTPPATWDDYAASIDQLRKLEPQFAFGALEPLAAGWSGRMLLARAAAYAQHRSYLSDLFDPEDMRALIGNPPYVRALEELAKQDAARQSLELTPQQSVEALAEGKTPAAIGWWANDESAWNLPESASLQVVPLPGARQSFDRQRATWDERQADAQHVTLLGFAGRLAAVGRKARSERAAASLLVWLSGEWSEVVSPPSSATTLFRGRHQSQPDRWLPKNVTDQGRGTTYADAVAATYHSQTFSTAPRIPGEAEYLTALDEAIAKTVRGESSSADALKEAAAKWDEITDRLGRETQREAYRHSLGL